MRSAHVKSRAENAPTTPRIALSASRRGSLSFTMRPSTKCASGKRARIEHVIVLLYLPSFDRCRLLMQAFPSMTIFMLTVEILESALRPNTGAERSGWTQSKRNEQIGTGMSASRLQCRDRGADSLSMTRWAFPIPDHSDRFRYRWCDGTPPGPWLGLRSLIEQICGPFLLAYGTLSLGTSREELQSSSPSGFPERISVTPIRWNPPCNSFSTYRNMESILRWVFGTGLQEASAAPAGTFLRPKSPAFWPLVLPEGLRPWRSG